jgi:hypothetical protein
LLNGSTNDAICWKRCHASDFAALANSSACLLRQAVCRVLAAGARISEHPHGWEGATDGSPPRHRVVDPCARTCRNFEDPSHLCANATRPILLALAPPSSCAALARLWCHPTLRAALGPAHAPPPEPIYSPSLVSHWPTATACLRRATLCARVPRRLAAPHGRALAWAEKN